MPQATRVWLEQDRLAQHQVNGDADEDTASTPPGAQRPQSEHEAADDHQLAVQSGGEAQPSSGS